MGGIIDLGGGDGTDAGDGGAAGGDRDDDAGRDGKGAGADGEGSEDGTGGEQGSDGDAGDQDEGEGQPDLDKLRAEWEADRLKDRPASADDYTLPEIEGFDHELAARSPIVAELRGAAHEAGLSQEKFAEVIGRYAAAEKQRTEEAYAATVKELGGEERFKARTAEVSRFLKASLPLAEAQALAASVTDAAGLRAIERLMSLRAKSGGREDPPAVEKDDWATIETLMKSKAYSGNAKERDPAVVKRVDSYFAAGGKRGGK